MNKSIFQTKQHFVSKDKILDENESFVNYSRNLFIERDILHRIDIIVKKLQNRIIQEYVAYTNNKIRNVFQIKLAMRSYQEHDRSLFNDDQKALWNNLIEDEGYQKLDNRREQNKFAFERLHSKNLPYQARFTKQQLASKFAISKTSPYEANRKIYKWCQ